MRQATHDVGFMHTESGALMGFCLGFDFCAEHEFGVRYMKDNLGIESKPFPIGVEDRTMTLVPEHLGFATYDWKSDDKRIKKTMPAAILHMCRAREWADAFPEDGAGIVEFLHMRFYGDPFKKADARWYRPEKDDVRCHWGSDDGFAIHVRGEDNVKHLKALYEAMLQCKVSLADPAINGFMRKAMSLVLVDAIDPALAEHVKEQDLAHKHLYDSFAATGIEELLKAAGKKYYALKPGWRANNVDGQLMAFLNPAEQKKYNFGWYTIEELRQWAQDRGPVVDGLSAKEALKALDVDYSYHFVGGANAKGAPINFETEVWCDEAKTIPGLRVLWSDSASVRMPDGNYSYEQLQFYMNAGREERKREEAAREAAKAASATAAA